MEYPNVHFPEEQWHPSLLANVDEDFRVFNILVP
jgi:hypothetical protein